MRRDIRVSRSQENIEFYQSAGSAIAISEGVDPLDIDMCDNRLNDRLDESLPLTVVKLTSQPIAEKLHELWDMFVFGTSVWTNNSRVSPKMAGHGVEVLTQILADHLVKLEH